MRKNVTCKRDPEARDRDVATFLRDRDETETLGKCVSRPPRDRDVETETTDPGPGKLYELWFTRCGTFDGRTKTA